MIQGRALVGAAVVGCLALPVARQALERAMIVHMLVQIPALAVAGALMGSALPARWMARLREWNAGGLTGILLALIASSWWMLPRALDGALSDPWMETAKFVSLPFFVGLPTALSWPELSFIGRGFVVVNVLPMWAVVGWLYIVAPTRLCNFYLADQQVTAGVGLLCASIGAALAFGALSFRSVQPSTARPG
jgi:hypothetical protein